MWPICYDKLALVISYLLRITYNFVVNLICFLGGDDVEGDTGDGGTCVTKGDGEFQFALTILVIFQHSSSFMKIIIV